MAGSMLLRAFLFFLVVVTSVSSPASAQTGVGTSVDGDARTLFQLGQQAFEEGRYQAALDCFRQAFDLSHRPQLLYNIGQAADRLRDDRLALASFEQFLREVPDSPQHASTRARVELLRAEIAADEARAAAAADAEARASSAASRPAAETSDAGPSATPGWIVLGASGAALAVGSTFLALGLRDNASVEDAPMGSSFEDVRDAYDRGPTRITVGAILLGVGAAGAATGLVLALRASGHDDAPTALSLDVLPGGLRLRGSF